jgi:uncharacterized protein YdiU (UPF0061 family)
LEQFLPSFKRHLSQRTLALLGLTASAAQAQKAQETVSALYLAMRQTQIPFAQCLFDLLGGGIETRLAKQSHAVLYQTDSFKEVIKQLQDFSLHPAYALAKEHAYFQQDSATDLLIEKVEALWAPIAQDDDWTDLNQFIAAIRHKGEAYAPLLATAAIETRDDLT